MPTQPVSRIPLSLITLVTFNLVPLYGVFAWGWQSFDLIILYWMENVVIGVFTLGRMVIRPYSHPIELAFPLFFAPFFAAHYGGFTWGHGTFIISLFAPDHLNSFDLLPSVLEIMSAQNMIYALLALTLIQLMDWGRDIGNRGLGADNLKDLMTKPYRRVVVLHLTIIGAGFTLGALDEPVIGLLLLIIFKTASDVWHWHKDAEQETMAITFTPAHLAEMQALYPRPVVTVNDEEREFASFAELEASKEFRFAQALMRIVGANEDLHAVRTYLDMKIEEERAAPITASAG